MNIRSTDTIEILNVIVHVIDHQQHNNAEVSQSELNVDNLDEKIKGFIVEHIRASILNAESKLAKFDNRTTNVQSYINEILNDPLNYFVRNSQDISRVLFSVTPPIARPGCMVLVRYSNSLEELIAIIKLDKNDAIAYEENDYGTYELVLKGTTLPLPSKTSKLQKCAIVRSSETISNQEWDTKPALVVLDKQVADFSLFFYREFLKSNFLLTDSHKSEKLMDGIVSYLRINSDITHAQKHVVLQSFGSKIINGEEFTIEEASRQIFSPYYDNEENLLRVVEQVERIVLEHGIGDTNLRGQVTPKIEKALGIKKVKTTENIQISFPSEHMNTLVKIETIPNSDKSNIIISNVHIKN